MSGLVGVDGRCRRRHGVQCVGTASASDLNTNGQRVAVALAHDDDDVALAGLVARKATVAAVLLVVRRLHVAAEIGAIDFDVAR